MNKKREELELREPRCKKKDISSRQVHREPTDIPHLDSLLEQVASNINRCTRCFSNWINILYNEVF